MGIFHPSTSQPKSVWGCHCPSNLLKVTRRICDRGSELRQNPASNSSFLSRASTVFLAFPARINEIERSQGLTAREAEISGSSDWLFSPLAELGTLHSPSNPQQLCRGSAGKLTTVCVHASLPLMGTLPSPLYLLGYFFDPPIRLVIALFLISLFSLIYM